MAEWRTDLRATHALICAASLYRASARLLSACTKPSLSPQIVETGHQVAQVAHASHDGCQVIEVQRKGKITNQRSVSRQANDRSLCIAPSFPFLPLPIPAAATQRPRADTATGCQRAHCLSSGARCFGKPCCAILASTLNGADFWMLERGQVTLHKDVGISRWRLDGSSCRHVTACLW